MPSDADNAPLQTPPQLPQQPGSGKKKMLAVVSIIIVVVLIAAGVGYVLMNRDKKTAQTPATKTAKVKVGVLLALSGGSSSMGYGAIKGIDLAKKQLAADNIELIQADGKCDPKAAPAAMEYLIKQHVVAVIGENCSSATTAVLDMANKNHILLISPSASSPLLSKPDDFFFRTVPSDIGQGTFLAQSIYKAGYKTAAVFYTAEPYGTAINDVFKQQFESLGGKVVAAVSADSSVIDVQSQVAAIKAANPAAIAIVTNSTVSSTAVMKLARQAGVTAPFYGGDNLYDNTIITNNGAAAEGLHVVSFPTGTQAFKQDLLNEYHVTEQLYAAPESYDAFNVIYKAVQKGARTGDDFKRIVPGIKFQGVSGDIAFDKNGEIPYQTYKYDLLEVKDGAFTVVNQ
jgi:branched-chain amino acid transport system substrate-binding protein